MKKYDCVLCTMPVVDINAPLLAPHLLKGYLNQKGFKTLCVDFNLQLYNYLKENDINLAEDFGRIVGTSNRFLTDHTDFFNAPMGEYLWWNEETFEEAYVDFLKPALEDWVEQLHELDTEWVGLSLFSKQSVIVTKKLCSLIKQKYPTQKIVIGGIGSKNIGEDFLIDHHITGEGEMPLEQLLSGNPTNVFWENHDMDILPFPDYSDINIDDYGGEKARIYVQGSKGCVRKCLFCTVPKQYPTYVTRDGATVAQEMIQCHEQLGVRKFFLIDSLVNGSLKYMRDYCSTLANYYSETSCRPFFWNTFAIVRPKGQMLKSDYQLLVDSGCDSLKVGIESGSESVRYHMGKKFTNDDLYAHLDLCQEVGLKLRTILMVGYPTETEEDFKETLLLVENMKRYQDIIIQIPIGPTLALLENSYLYDKSDELEIVKSTEGKYPAREWVYKDNTFSVRLERHQRLRDKCIDCGFADVLNDPLKDIREELINEKR